MLRQDDYQSAMLVTAAWRYGSEYGGHLATNMIMSCIVNRHKLGWGTLLEVIERIPNFAASDCPNANKFPPIWEPGFIKLLHDVAGVKEGSAKDLSNGGLYWHDLSKPVTNYWFQEKILGNKQDHPMVANMNSLSFFR